jgi:hypothetical protein
MIYLKTACLLKLTVLVKRLQYASQKLSTLTIEIDLRFFLCVCMCLVQVVTKNLHPNRILLIWKDY